ncbi:hypothetical protein AKO1_015286 [Acrasis kona]|uniref:Uncharacterized protein n=1 Tax=Acrasis kona TaxID=1008807 RepID=A0AAW2ZEZ1_9EUKA
MPGSCVVAGSYDANYQSNAEHLHNTISNQQYTIDMLVEENNRLKNMLANLTGQSNHRSTAPGSSNIYFTSLKSFAPFQNSYSDYDTYISESGNEDEPESGVEPESYAESQQAEDIRIELERSEIKFNHSRIWIPEEPKRRSASSKKSDKKSKKYGVKQDLSNLYRNVRESFCFAAQDSR